MNSKHNSIGDLNKALDYLSLKKRKNLNGLIHDQVRDFFINNLKIIDKRLEFVDSELRTVGGTIDIIAKDKENIFYLIEVKTSLSKYPIGNIGPINQLLTQQKGLQYTFSLFTNIKLNLKLIVVEYVRDKKLALITFASGSGKIERLSEIDLDVDE